MAEFVAICLLSLAMFVGCILAGWIPLAFTLSQVKIRLHLTNSNIFSGIKHNLRKIMILAIGVSSLKLNILFHV